MARHSILEVNLSALKQNLNLIRAYLHEGQKIIAIVKANAYGLGAVEVSRFLEKNNIDFFAVSCIREAIELREAGIESRVLVLSPFFESEIPLFLEYGITPTITDIERAVSLEIEAEKAGQEVPVHIKVDTGMGRLGFKPEKLLEDIHSLKKLSHLKLEGIFSHFPTADLLDDFSQEQIDSFKILIENLKEKGVEFSIKHIDNSSGIIAYNDPFFNAVRPGIILYGVSPSNAISELVSPKTTVRWKSKVIQIKMLQKGESVSYGRTFQAEKNMKIAVVPCGYADGFSTLNSGNGQVLVQGEICPVLGRVCMDYFMVDVSELELNVGEEVLLCGEEKGISPEDIAGRTGLIPYEILTGIDRSTPRVYFS